LRRSRSNGVGNKFSRIEKIAASYRKMLNIEADNSPHEPLESGLLIAYAYPDRIAAARPGNNAQFQLANGRIVSAGHKDDLAHEPWLAVASADMRDGPGKIFLASPLNPRDLVSMIEQKDTVTWDVRKGGLIAAKETKIGNIVLQTKPISNPDKELIKQALIKAIKEQPAELLAIDENFEQLQNKLASLKIWNEGEDWPEAAPEKIFGDPSWLEPYLEGVKRNEDLKKIDLVSAYKNSLEWAMQEKIEKLAPDKLAVPSGSKIGVRYFNNGAPPVLAVRLQEVFGMAETPTVNNGKIKMVMHLLSPGYKPVQVTSDLKSFWNNLYFEVKKELQRRYPKHSWPDDPWKAVPVAKGRSYK
jgi:ATP-dependent helicase HrpB